MTDGSRGRLIALEGIDGCGKSTQAGVLAARLGAVLTFEPGATPLGSHLRGLLLDSERPPLAERTEALLMAADRAQHVAAVVAPALQAGDWVVTDRFSGSTLAYQGYGRGLGLPGLRQLVDWATGGLRADLSILIEVPSGLAAERSRPDRLDRFEVLGPEFHQRVADGFHQLATDDPEAWVVVDGTGGVDEVAASVWSAVRERLGEPTGG
ncbi:MAG TPA: dTMP kinase [Acidimicrobiales bacterium]|nr:dTMP kinase [Acidimicrobiales bacterium]